MQLRNAGSSVASTGDPYEAWQLSPGPSAYGSMGPDTSQSGTTRTTYESEDDVLFNSFGANIRRSSRLLRASGSQIEMLFQGERTRSMRSSGLGSGWGQSSSGTIYDTDDEDSLPEEEFFSEMEFNMMDSINDAGQIIALLKRSGR
mmetsp:Transcript_8965/g.26033  ORF Transcript_8965/g.26033 Transcript_8965/m.26033 type:complete len:146 (-) Transcript_8965:229-666(-)